MAINQSINCMHGKLAAFYLTLTLSLSLLSACATINDTASSNPNAETEKSIKQDLSTEIPKNPDFHDSHFHLTNYIQEGISVEKYLEIMGDRVGRSTLFGIPLQQTWSYGNSGNFAPTYYLHSDAPLYYYSFTDAYIAKVYQQLDSKIQQRFDPMITGFNPSDMYAVDHIRRVLTTFPGVFAVLVNSAYIKNLFLQKSPVRRLALLIRHWIEFLNSRAKPG